MFVRMQYCILMGLSSAQFQQNRVSAIRELTLPLFIMQHWATGGEAANVHVHHVSHTLQIHWGILILDNSLNDIRNTIGFIKSFCKDYAYHVAFCLMYSPI